MFHRKDGKVCMTMGGFESDAPMDEKGVAVNILITRATNGLEDSPRAI
jgi:hypothetical protein